MEFRIHIFCNNAAFAPEAADMTTELEVARILGKLVEELETGTLSSIRPGWEDLALYDVNGNYTGRAQFIKNED
jgi:hypothetical protein